MSKKKVYRLKKFQERELKRAYEDDKVVLPRYEKAMKIVRPKVQKRKVTRANPYTANEIGIMQHTSRLPSASLQKSVYKKYGLAKKIRKNTETAAEEKPFLFNTLRSMQKAQTFGLADPKKQLEKAIGKIDTKDADDSSWGRAGDFIGTGLGYMSTAGLGEGAIAAGLTRNAGKKVFNGTAKRLITADTKKAVGKELRVAGGRKALPTAKKFASRRAADVIAGTAINLPYAAQESDNRKEFAGSLLANTATDVAFGGAFDAAAKGLRVAGKKHADYVTRKTKADKVVEEIEAVKHTGIMRPKTEAMKREDAAKRELTKKSQGDKILPALEGKNIRTRVLKKASEEVKPITEKERYLPEHSKLLDERGYPVQAKEKTGAVKITQDELAAIEKELHGLNSGKLRKSVRDALKIKYAGKNVEIKGVSEKGKPYIATITRKGLWESTSKHLPTAEDAAILHRINEIVEKANYKLSEPSRRDNNMIKRTDAFETNVDLAGKNKTVKTRTNVTENEGNKIYNIGIIKKDNSYPQPSAAQSLQNGDADKNFLKIILPKYSGKVNRRDNGRVLPKASTAAKDNSEKWREETSKFKKDNPKYRQFEEDLSAKYGDNIPTNRKLSDATILSLTDQGISRGKDIQRNIEAATHGHPEARAELKKVLEEPLYKSKKEYTEDVIKKTDDMYSTVVEKLGIKKGSKESAGIQWYGEGEKLVLDGKGNPIPLDKNGKVISSNKDTPVTFRTEKYTEDDLKKEFNYKMKNGEPAWKNIIAAEKWFRNQYDGYVDRINESMKKIYPDVEKNTENLRDRLSKLPNKKEKIHQQSRKLQERLSKIPDEEKQIQKQIIKLQEQLLKKPDKESIYRIIKKIKTAKEDAKEKTALEQIAKLQKRLSKLPDKIKVIHQQEKNLQKRLSEIPNEEKRIRQQIEDEIVGHRLQKRKDYFRHFQEQPNLIGIDNILNSATNIDPRLVGITEYTQPKSKYSGFMQRRKGKNDYTADAIGGMLEYIPQAEYKIHIEPNIQNIRSVIKEIQENTIQSRNANDFINMLQNQANDLAGKTNEWDRTFDKMFYGDKGRVAINALNTISTRMRSNAIMGNINSIFAQFFNMPNVVGYVKNPVHIAEGMADAMDAATNPRGEKAALLKKSGFLRERYLDRHIRKFDRGVLNNINRFFVWSMEAGDKAVADAAWFAFYRKAIAKGMKEEKAISYADEFTRKSVAGRGIAEMPLSQKARVTKLFAPFQVEVRNALNVMLDMAKTKDAIGFAGVLVTSFIMNEAMEVVTGRRVSYDPLNVVKKVIVQYKTGKQTASEAAKSLGLGLFGETLSNVPGGSYIAEGIENYTEIDPYTWQELFGDSDPSRFGTGNMAVQALARPIGQIVKGQNIDILRPAASLLPRYGGKQIEKTVRGLQDMAVLPRANIRTGKKDEIKKQNFPASYNSTGKIRFAMNPSAKDYILAPTFSSWSTEEGKKYIDKDEKPLSDKATAIMEKTATKNNAAAVEKLIRKLPKAKEKTVRNARELIMNSDFTAKQKNKLGKLIDTQMKVDYTNKTSFEISQLNKDSRKKIKKIQKTGISASTALTVYNNCLKAAKKKAWPEHTYLAKSWFMKGVIDGTTPGMSSAQRRHLYDLYGVSEKIW